MKQMDQRSLDFQRGTEAAPGKRYATPVPWPDFSRFALRLPDAVLRNTKY
jgi:hypothetical protein